MKSNCEVHTSTVAGWYCLSIEFIVLILYFVLQCFIYFYCFLCILCSTHLLPTVLVVVTSVLTVHFDICILPTYIFDDSWGTGGKRKLQEGGMTPILTLDLGGGADRSRLALRPKLGLIYYITVTVKCYRPAVVVVERL